MTEIYYSRVECMRCGLLRIAIDDSGVCQSICVSRGRSVQKRLNGSTSCLESRLSWYPVRKVGYNQRRPTRWLAGPNFPLGYMARCRVTTDYSLPPCRPQCVQLQRTTSLRSSRPCWRRSNCAQICSWVKRCSNFERTQLRAS